MPPAATLRHSRSEAAVGRAANERNLDGSTPIIATYLSFTWIRAASIDTAAAMPGSRCTALNVAAGSEALAATITSGSSNFRSGATGGDRAVASSLATGTDNEPERLPPAVTAAGGVVLPGGGGNVAYATPGAAPPTRAKASSAVPPTVAARAGPEDNHRLGRSLTRGLLSGD